MGHAHHSRDWTCTSDHLSRWCFDRHPTLASLHEPRCISYHIQFCLDPIAVNVSGWSNLTSFLGFVLPCQNLGPARIDSLPLPVVTSTTLLTSIRSTSSSSSIGLEEINNAKGLSSGTRISIGVIVPIAVLALFCIAKRIFYRKAPRGSAR